MAINKCDVKVSNVVVVISMKSSVGKVIVFIDIRSEVCHCLNSMSLPESKSSDHSFATMAAFTVTHHAGFAC